MLIFKFVGPKSLIKLSSEALEFAISTVGVRMFFDIKGNFILVRLSHPRIIILLNCVYCGIITSFNAGQFSNLSPFTRIQLSGIITLSRFGQSTNLSPYI